MSRLRNLASDTMVSRLTLVLVLVVLVIGVMTMRAQQQDAAERAELRAAEQQARDRAVATLMRAMSAQLDELLGRIDDLEAEDADRDRIPGCDRSSPRRTPRPTPAPEPQPSPEEPPPEPEPEPEPTPPPDDDGVCVVDVCFPL